MAVWTSMDADFLRVNFGHASDESIAEALGRSVPAIRSYAVKLGLKRPRRYDRYIVSSMATGEVVARGTADTCSAALSMSPQSLLSLFSRLKAGTRAGRYWIERDLNPEPLASGHCQLHLIPGANCPPGQCSHCGWYSIVAKQRLKAIRSGHMIRNPEGRLRLVIPSGLPQK